MERNEPHPTDTKFARKCRAHLLPPRMFIERDGREHDQHVLRCDSGCFAWGPDQPRAMQIWNQMFAVEPHLDRMPFAEGGVIGGGETVIPLRRDASNRLVIDDKSLADCRTKFDNAGQFPKDGPHIETPVEKLCNAHRLIDEATLALVDLRDRGREKFAALEAELDSRAKKLADFEKANAMLREQRDEAIQAKRRFQREHEGSSSAEARMLRDELDLCRKERDAARDERDKLKLRLADVQQALVLIREQRDENVGAARHLRIERDEISRERDSLRAHLRDMERQRDEVAGKLREAEAQGVKDHAAALNASSMRGEIASLKKRVHDTENHSAAMRSERNDAIAVAERALNERNELRAQLTAAQAALAKQIDDQNRLLIRAGVGLDENGVFVTRDNGSRTYLRPESVQQLHKALETSRDAFMVELAVAQRERDEAEADLFTAREDVRRLMDEQAARKLSAG